MSAFSLVHAGEPLPGTARAASSTRSSTYGLKVVAKRDGAVSDSRWYWSAWRTSLMSSSTSIRLRAVFADVGGFSATTDLDTETRYPPSTAVWVLEEAMLLRIHSLQTYVRD